MRLAVKGSEPASPAFRFSIAFTRSSKRSCQRIPASVSLKACRIESMSISRVKRAAGQVSESGGSSP